MKTKLLTGIICIALLSCKRHDPAVPGEELKIYRLEKILTGDNQYLINLLNQVRGSVGTRGNASKTLWSRKNHYGLGLYICANHVYGLDGWPSRKAQFFDLSSEKPGIFETSTLPSSSGKITGGDTLSADFPLIHFDISPAVTNTTILPEEDFYLGIVDNQRIPRSPFPVYPEGIKTDAPLQMYDPAGRTRAPQTWNEPVHGENAIAIGYPADKANFPNGAVVYSKILPHTQAEEVIRKLKATGDEEGSIPYNPGVEFLIDAPGFPGMSGGGVFNSSGQLLGIMVRASQHTPEIIRVVKAAFIRSEMIRFYNTLPESDKEKIRPFISGEL